MNVERRQKDGGEERAKTPASAKLYLWNKKSSATSFTTERSSAAFFRYFVNIICSPRPLRLQNENKALIQVPDDFYHRMMRMSFYIKYIYMFVYFLRLRLFAFLLLLFTLCLWFGFKSCSIYKIETRCNNILIFIYLTYI